MAKINGIQYKTAKTIIEELGQISTLDTNLDLSFIGLFKRSESEIMSIFENIPDHIERLNLEGNKLDMLNKDILTSCLESLPTSLKYINISNNNLPTEGQVFRQIIRAIPATIENICIFGIVFHNRMQLNQMIEKDELNEQLFFFKCIAAGSAMGGAALLISAMLWPTIPLLFNAGIVLLGISSLISTGLILNSLFKKPIFEESDQGNPDTKPCCFF